MSPERIQLGPKNTMNMIITPSMDQQHIMFQGTTTAAHPDGEMTISQYRNHSNEDSDGRHVDDDYNSNNLIEEEHEEDIMDNVINEEHVISSEEIHYQSSDSNMYYDPKERREEVVGESNMVYNKNGHQNLILANGVDIENFAKLQQQIAAVHGRALQTGHSKVMVLRPPNNNESFIKGAPMPSGEIVVLSNEQQGSGGEVQQQHHSDGRSCNGEVKHLSLVENEAPKQPNAVGSTTDEDLTSLSWLQDKNLIRGINISCAKVQSSSEHNGPSSSNSGRMSPTSDDLDDSCVSEDNNHAITTNNNNSDDISKADQAFIEENSSKLFLNTRPTRLPHPPKTTTAIHVSPGGTKTTTTVIEYHPIPTLSNTVMASSASTSPTTKTIYTIKHNVPLTSSDHREIGSQETLGQLSPHQSQIPLHPHQPQSHIHKKYRREEHVKILKQQQQQMQQHVPYGPVGMPSNVHFTGSPQKQQQNQSHLFKYSPSDAKHYEDHSGELTTSSRTSHKNNLPGNKQKHPNNLPYDPFVHTSNKPPLSFSSLIFMAIENAPEKALPVKEIYAWIVKHFPYFKTAPTGWKNSVRHNLSLNKCFQKVEKAPNMGKGSLWRVEQQYRQVLMQALTRSPYQLTTAIEKSGPSPKSSSSSGQIQSRVVNSTDANNNSYNSLSSSNISSASSSLSSSPTGGHQTNNKLLPNGRHFNSTLFPHLSKAMAELDPNNNSLEGEIELHRNFKSSFLNGLDVRGRKGFRYEHEDDYCEGDEEDYYEDDYPEGSSESRRLRHAGVESSDTGVFSGSSGEWVMSTGDSIDDVNAATAMLALKHGPKFFAESFRNGRPVITSSPSEDHTYVSACNVHLKEDSEQAAKRGETELENNNDSGMKNRNGGDHLSNGTTSSDAAYESSEESHLNNSSHMSTMELELEEQRKKAEGVDALLNLAAGFAVATSTPLKRRNSDDGLEPNNSIMLSSPSPPKKSKTRTLRTKLKNKTSWLR